MNFSVTDENNFEVRYDFCINMLKGLVTPNRELHNKCLELLEDVIDQMRASSDMTDDSIVSSPEFLLSEDSLDPADSDQTDDSIVSPPEFLLSEDSPDPAGEMDKSNPSFFESASFQEQLKEIYKEPDNTINGVAYTFSSPAGEHSGNNFDNISSSNNVKHNSSPSDETIQLDAEQNLAKASSAQHPNFLEDLSVEQICESDVIVQKGNHKRGRPQNSSVLTVGGTKRKKLQMIPFALLDEPQQRRRMIHWVLPAPAAQNACEGAYKIKLLNINEIRESFYDKIVNIDILKKDFEKSAFTKFKSLLKKKVTAQKNGSCVFSCAKCKIGLSETSTVCCEFCLLRFHFECTGLNKKLRRNSQWQCEFCENNFRS